MKQTIITQQQDAARIVAEGGRYELRAGRYGTGKLIAAAAATPQGRDALIDLAHRAGYYVWGR